jgi:hypothetical protein
VYVQLSASGRAHLLLSVALEVLPGAELGAALLLGPGDHIPAVVLLGTGHQLLHSLAVFLFGCGSGSGSDFAAHGDDSADESAGRV